MARKDLLAPLVIPDPLARLANKAKLVPLVLKVLLAQHGQGKARIPWPWVVRAL